MKIFEILFLLNWLFPIFTGSFAMALDSGEEVIQKSNTKYLSGRVHAMLAERLTGVTRCSLSTQNELLSHFNTFPKYTEDKTILEDLVSFYHKTYQQADFCLKSLNAGEIHFHNLERNRFSAYYSLAHKACRTASDINRNYDGVICTTRFSQVLLDLNPHCISTQVPFDPKYHDSFICMAGDILIGKKLYEFFQNPYDQFFEIKEFLHRYWDLAHQALASNSEIEMYDIFNVGKSDTYETRLRFLSVMTFLLASTKSTSPYIKGFQDFIWRTHVLKTGNAKEAVDLFIKFRGITDEFKTVNGLLMEKKAKITVIKQDIRTVNRHNMMASFLACNYRDHSQAIRKILPLAMGYAYESYDFISHLKEHISLEQSLGNFKTDVRRYSVGVNTGERFCSFR